MIIIFISFLFIVNTSVVGKTTNDTSFNEFDPSNLTGCGCHNGGSPNLFLGAGLIDIEAPTVVAPGVPFNVNISVNGFLDASSENITVGFRTADGDNSEFISSVIQQNDHLLDVSGHSSSKIVFPDELFPPGVQDNYTLVALAVWADGTSDFYYIYSNVTIEVSGSADKVPPVIHSVLLDSVEASNSLADLSTDVLVQVNATDNVAMKRVSLIIDTDDPIEMLFNNVSNLYNYTLNTYFIPNGPFTLKIFAEDSLGNNATMTYNLNVLNTGVEGDVTAWKMVKSEIIIGDGVVDEYWDNIDEFKVEEFSTGNTDGWVKASHDGYYLYMLVAYVADLENYWIAFELDADDENMVDGHDGWAFGMGHDETNYYGDVYYRGSDTHPAIDSRNDISFEKIDTEGEVIVYYEFKRPLITNDEDGKDFDLVEGEIYNIKFASSKPAFHKSGHREVHTFAISQSFPSGNGDPTTTTTSTNTRSPQQVKDENIINFFLLAGLGFGLNISIIVIIYIFQRRKVL
ncbi:MAG: hypothetical protein HeimC3_39900 [Candidatus Heimdallarchaeota archaeon LC_3]|nr:MAG: hypothetical protein HeimC3_39900 [Candidatus Heimdallarchaeota archaeon LC_3]